MVFRLVGSLDLLSFTRKWDLGVFFYKFGPVYEVIKSKILSEMDQKTHHFCIIFHTKYGAKPDTKIVIASSVFIENIRMTTRF